MDLGDRKKAILRVLISDYIQTAEPVGSRTISKKPEIGISSATIRNEMADLEELGYLEQPHASAGRIPSDKAYRLYVDELMEIEALSDIDINNIKSILHLTAISELEKVIKRTTHLLSQITKYTSAILSPSAQRCTLKSLQLIKATQNDILAVVVTDTGLIKHVMIKVPKNIEANDLAKINNMLNDKLRNRTIEDINLSVISSIQHGMHGYDEMFNAIIPVLYESLSTNDSDVYLEGATNIFQYPEYNDMDRARNFLYLIEQKDIMFDIFSENSGNISISIGGENKNYEVKNCSIVKASYKLGNRTLGTVGVIGPTRMDYPRVIATLNCCTQTLNQILKTFNDE